MKDRLEPSWIMDSRRRKFLWRRKRPPGGGAKRGEHVARVVRCLEELGVPQLPFDLSTIDVAARRTRHLGSLPSRLCLPLSAAENSLVACLASRQSDKVISLCSSSSSLFSSFLRASKFRSTTRDSRLAFAVLVRPFLSFFFPPPWKMSKLVRGFVAGKCNNRFSNEYPPMRIFDAKRINEVSWSGDDDWTSGCVYTVEKCDTNGRGNRCKFEWTRRFGSAGLDSVALSAAISRPVRLHLFSEIRSFLRVSLQVTVETKAKTKVQKRKKPVTSFPRNDRLSYEVLLASQRRHGETARSSAARSIDYHIWTSWNDNRGINITRTLRLATFFRDHDPLWSRFAARVFRKFPPPRFCRLASRGRNERLVSSERSEVFFFFFDQIVALDHKVGLIDSRSSSSKFHPFISLLALVWLLGEVTGVSEIVGSLITFLVAVTRSRLSSGLFDGKSKPPPVSPTDISVSPRRSARSGTFRNCVNQSFGHQVPQRISRLLKIGRGFVKLRNERNSIPFRFNKDQPLVTFSKLWNFSLSSTRPRESRFISQQRTRRNWRHNDGKLPIIWTVAISSWKEICSRLRSVKLLLLFTEFVCCIFSKIGKIGKIVKKASTKIEKIEIFSLQRSLWNLPRHVFFFSSFTRF